MKYLLVLVTSVFSFSASAQQIVFTSDVTHFWEAYDSVQTTTDSLKQLQYIKKLYMDKGTPGFQTFAKIRNCTADQYVSLIRRCPKFWTSIRPKTFSVISKQAAIEAGIQSLRRLYPELKPAKIYFTIGCLHAEGTTRDDQVLVGTELAAGDSLTDVSEAPVAFARNVFKNQDTSNIVYLNVHEYVHTQQSSDGSDLLGNCLAEGAADFMAELATGKPLHNTYILYGRAHEATLKEEFKREMFLPYIQNWLYNARITPDRADLGYFMGYSICSAYYARMGDKAQAIRDIIQLKYEDTAAVAQFLDRSGYYLDHPDRAGLILSYRAQQPHLVGIRLPSGALAFQQDSILAPGVKEVVLVFSEPMRGMDSALFIIKLDLKPGEEYHKVISGNRFMSQRGYALADYTLNFRTSAAKP